MQICTGAICGRRRGVADGLTPGSIVISLTLGILKGEAPDAAASAGRFVSFAPDALLNENLLIAHTLGCRDGRVCSGCNDTIESNEQLRGMYHLTCAMKT